MEWTYVQPQSIADVVPHFGCSNTRVTIAGINLYGGTLATFWVTFGGHTANSAKWKKKEKNKNKKEEKSIVDNSKPNLFNFNPSSIKSTSNYIKKLLDTGATCHIVNKKSYFHKYYEQTTKETVKVTNGKEVQINGYGDILWKTKDTNGRSITVKIRNVKLISTMTENLLSLSSIFEQYKNASKIDGKKDHINLKIRNNTIKFKISNMLFKNVGDNKIEKENLFSTNVKAVKTTNISENCCRNNI